MLHLKYFKSNHCEDVNVDWGLLGVENYTNSVQPIRSEEVAAVERTFWISFWYLIFNVYLIIAIAVLKCEFFYEKINYF